MSEKCNKLKCFSVVESKASLSSLLRIANNPIVSNTFYNFNFNAITSTTLPLSSQQSPATTTCLLTAPSFRSGPPRNSLSMSGTCSSMFQPKWSSLCSATWDSGC